jgi:Cys-tRNA(Pro)/Cys-tRNA(Cys) deacylase
LTPAIESATRAGISFDIHEYDHDPQAESYGLEAAEKLKAETEKIFKTLVIQSDKNALAVAIVPVQKTLDLKAVAAALGVKKVRMADKAQVERTTGYFVGGVSPLGQKRRLPTLIDSSASDHELIFVSGGRRGLDISLSPKDLARLCEATLIPISR